jgi:hypothetical protein
LSIFCSSFFRNKSFNTRGITPPSSKLVDVDAVSVLLFKNVLAADKVE